MSDILELLQDPEFISLIELNKNSSNRVISETINSINQLGIRLNRLAFELFGGKKIGLIILPSIIYPDISLNEISTFSQDINQITQDAKLNPIDRDRLYESTMSFLKPKQRAHLKVLTEISRVQSLLNN